MKRILLIAASAALILCSCTSEVVNDPVGAPLRDHVIAQADADMNLVPVTVTSFPTPLSAGTIHDFFSQADYFWPDPDNPDGPYKERDGLTNPDNFVAHRKALNDMCIAVSNLASAWLLTGESKYSDAILPHIEAWFVNEDTRMAPNLKYSQAVVNGVTGRSWGVIDSIHLIEVAKALMRMEERGMIPEDLLKSSKEWFADYVQWLTTDPNGVKEMNAGNNHGVCWLLQTGVFAQYAGLTDVVNLCKDRYKTVYLPTMDPEGMFPYEFGRTKGYGYSLFQLDAMVGACQAFSTADDDLWAYTTEDGKNIGTAINWMFNYVVDKASWPKEPDVMYWDEWPVAHPFLIFAWNHYRDDETMPAEDYYKTWLNLEHFPTTNEVLRNLPLRNPVLWLN